MNMNDILKCLGEIKVQPPSDVELWCISPDDFDYITEVLTGYGALIVPYSDEDDGWRYLVVEESPFTDLHTTKIAVMAEITKGTTLLIDRQKCTTFQPFVEYDQTRYVSYGWQRGRVIIPPLPE
jgi:hypothetical protein